MSLETFEAEIIHGQVTVKQADKLPERARGLLIVLAPENATHERGLRTRVALPLIQGDGVHIIDPSKEDLDASLWD